MADLTSCNVYLIYLSDGDIIAICLMTERHNNVCMSFCLPSNISQYHNTIVILNEHDTDCNLSQNILFKANISLIRPVSIKHVPKVLLAGKPNVLESSANDCYATRSFDKERDKHI